ncbi:unnamed protein product [Adineta steineri]|uniref:Transmembrane protein n=1 Tax=Adineta steineri TaxID=433720 RepID=A0A814RWS0_9BILA|nr:unnamed protein product [Adineta steineri]
MVIFQRLKDSFDYTQSSDNLQPEGIIGRRVLSTKKLLCLPSDIDSNFNTNSKKICLLSTSRSSLIIKKRKTNNNQYDVQQTKLKNLLIDELKCLFANRNQNNQQQYTNTNSKINMQFQTRPLTQKYPSRHRKQKVNSQSTFTKQSSNVSLSKTINNSTTLSIARTTILVSISILTSLLLSSTLIRSSKKFPNSLNIFNTILLYSTSFIFSWFGARYFNNDKYLS